MGEDAPPAEAGGAAAAAAAEPRRLSHNELEMARQYSETSARVSAALERGKDGKSITKQTKEEVDLKKELEMWEHKVTVEELAKRLNTDPKTGLSMEEAKLRLERDGPNMLSPPKVTPWWVKLGLQFLNFFALLLQVASVLCFIGYGLDREAVDNLCMLRLCLRGMRKGF